MVQGKWPVILALSNQRERKRLETLLKNRAVSFFCATNSKEICVLIESYPSALLVADVDFAREQEWPEEARPFLVLAGKPEELPSLREALPWGVRGVLEPPFTSRETEKELDRCLSCYFAEQKSKEDALSGSRQLAALKQALRRAFVRSLARGHEETLPSVELPKAGYFRLLCFMPENPATWDEGKQQAFETVFTQAWKPAGDLWPGGMVDGRYYGLLHESAALCPSGRETVFWLCGMSLMEACSTGETFSGTLYTTPPWETEKMPEQFLPMLPFRERVRPGGMVRQEQRDHRLRIQQYMKKGQHTHVPGYVARSLSEGSDVWPWIPLLLEAVWGVHQELPLPVLLSEFDSAALSQYGKAALIPWVRKLMREVKDWGQPQETSPIRRVMESIARDCSLPYSQSNLAESLGLTPAYFCRLFKKEVGISFSAYLTNARMAHAKELLNHGYLGPLGELAGVCGYANKSYFCQAFRRHTGQTVGVYRQRHAQRRDETT